MTKLPLVTAATAMLTASLLACSSNDPDDTGSGDDHHHHHPETDSGYDGHQSEFPSCQVIMEACHPLDTGTAGRITECHELAHDGTNDEMCAARKDECIGICTLPGTGSDAGSTDAGSLVDATAEPDAS